MEKNLTRHSGGKMKGKLVITITQTYCNNNNGNLYCIRQNSSFIKTAEYDKYN
jgi:hypothetical protein